MATRGSTAKSQLNNYLIICFFLGAREACHSSHSCQDFSETPKPDNSARFCANDRNGRNDKNDKVFGGLKTN